MGKNIDYIVEENVENYIDEKNQLIIEENWKLIFFVMEKKRFSDIEDISYSWVVFYIFVSLLKGT